MDEKQRLEQLEKRVGQIVLALGSSIYAGDLVDQLSDLGYEAEIASAWGSGKDVVACINGAAVVYDMRKGQWHFWPEKKGGHKAIARRVIDLVEQERARANKPKCKHCGKAMRAHWDHVMEPDPYHPWDRPASGKSTVRGYGHRYEGLFCNASCGYEYAVKVVRGESK
jgi:hypothetical protein